MPNPDYNETVRNNATMLGSIVVARGLPWSFAFRPGGAAIGCVGLLDVGLGCGAIGRDPQDAAAHSSFLAKPMLRGCYRVEANHLPICCYCYVATPNAMALCNKAEQK